MPISRRFSALAIRLDTLKSRFLPKHFNPVGRYSAREYDLARAYVVLAHAEIEAYLEDRAGAIVQRAEIEWRRNHRHSSVIRQICTSHSMRANRPWLPFSKDPTKIQSALMSYKSLITGNHGIKSTNLLTLVFPLGMPYQDVKPALRTELDNFGSFRGAIAHNSSIKTQQPIDIEGQYRKVTEIIRHLKVFDRRINLLR